MRQRRPRVAVAMAIAIAFVLGLASAVVAGSPSTVTGTGTDVDRVKVVSSTFPDSASSGGPEDLDGASRRLLLTATSLVVAEFTAEGTCETPLDGGNSVSGPNGNGEPGGPCAAAIHVENTNNGFVDEMDPASNGDYALTPCCFEPQSVAMNRSITLPPGDYTFQVVFAGACENGGPSSENSFGGGKENCFVHILDDWHLTVSRVT